MEVFMKNVRTSLWVACICLVQMAQGSEPQEPWSQRWRRAVMPLGYEEPAAAAYTRAQIARNEKERWDRSPEGKLLNQANRNYWLSDDEKAAFINKEARGRRAAARISKNDEAALAAAYGVGEPLPTTASGQYRGQGRAEAYQKALPWWERYPQVPQGVADFASSAQENMQPYTNRFGALWRRPGKELKKGWKNIWESQEPSSVTSAPVGYKRGTARQLTPAQEVALNAAYGEGEYLPTNPEKYKMLAQERTNAYQRAFDQLPWRERIQGVWQSEMPWYKKPLAALSTSVAPQIRSYWTEKPAQVKRYKQFRNEDLAAYEDQFEQLPIDEQANSIETAYRYLREKNARLPWYQRRSDADILIELAKEYPEAAQQASSAPAKQVSPGLLERFIASPVRGAYGYASELPSRGYQWGKNKADARAKWIAAINAEREANGEEE
jgi:hypothetical protein